MIFEQLNGNGACRTYLVACEARREAMLIDPVLENVERDLRMLGERGLTLIAVLDTHVHADHISGAASLRDRTGADYCMHRLSSCACVNRRVCDGDQIHVGGVTFTALHTPGHTQDSLTLLFEDRILTGDFLFIGEVGAGRTDLPGGDSGEHWDALQKLANLPGDIAVFPGHDYRGRHHSTLAEERASNPRLQARSREEYVAWLDSMRLGPADWMAAIIQANYACAQDPRASWIPVDQPGCEVTGCHKSVNAEIVREMEIHTLRAELMSDTHRPRIVDVRTPEEFSHDHIAGAMLLPVNELSAHMSQLDKWKHSLVVTVCKTGGRSATAAAILSVAGFRNVQSLRGGMTAWRQLVPAAPPRHFSLEREKKTA